MKIKGFLAVVLLLIARDASPRNTTDTDALRALPQAFAGAWAQHDGHQLARIMADDVDFVTVGATWLHGRRDFETYHSRLLSGRFKDATITPLETSVRMLPSGLAAVHWSWTIKGDRSADGSLRPPRSGLMTMVAQKRSGVWLVIVAQNTNAPAEGSPEAQDIKSPISVPRTGSAAETPK